MNTDKKKILCRHAARFLLVLLSPLALDVPLANAMSSTTQIAWPDKPVSAQAGWPDGVLELVNDPARTYGWNSWFSELPNDVNHYEFKVGDREDVQRLIRKFAAIKAPKIQIRLNPGKEATQIGFGHRVKEHHTPILFAVGNQAKVDEWYQRLPEVAPGVREFGVNRYTAPPTALPPTLTLFVGHEAIDLRQLEIPSTVELSAEILPADRENKENEAAIKAIEDFIKNRPTKPKEPSHETPQSTQKK